MERRRNASSSALIRCNVYEVLRNDTTNATHGLFAPRMRSTSEAPFKKTKVGLLHGGQRVSAICHIRSETHT